MSEFADIHKTMRNANQPASWKDFETRLCKEHRRIEADLIEEMTATLDAARTSEPVLKKTLMLTRIVAGIEPKKVTPSLTRAVARQAFDGNTPEVRTGGNQTLREIDNNCDNQIDKRIFDQAFAQVMAKKELMDMMPTLTTLIKNHNEFLDFLQAVDLRELVKDGDGVPMTRAHALEEAVYKVYRELDVERPRGKLESFADRFRIHL